MHEKDIPHHNSILDLLGIKYSEIDLKWSDKSGVKKDGNVVVAFPHSETLRLIHSWLTFGGLDHFHVVIVCHLLGEGEVNKDNMNELIDSSQPSVNYK